MIYTWPTAIKVIWIHAFLWWCLLSISQARIDLAEIGIVDYKSFNDYKNVVFENFLFALKFFYLL